MGVLFRRFLDLCLMRAGPQDLPASQTLLTLVLGLYVATGALLTTPLYGIVPSLLGAALDGGFMWLYTLALLSAVGLRARTLQTVSALAGAGTVFNLLALPLVQSLADLDPQRLETGAGGFSSVLYLVLLVWLLVVYGHVFRNALDRGRPVGLAAAFGYLLFSTMIVQMALPPVEVPG